MVTSSSSSSRLTSIFSGEDSALSLFGLPGYFFGGGLLDGGGLNPNGNPGGKYSYGGRYDSG